MEELNFKQKKHKHSKNFKYESAPERHHGAENDVASMIRKMQQQLVFLERKIDMLLGQSSPRPSRFEGHGGQTREESFGERSAYKGKKPFAPKGQAHGNSSGERSFFKGKKLFPSKRRPHP
ncbi:MAG: hypothetical protein L6416_07505 [Candidatus Omnitrophica bacterium]|nr:hypothetical protein [Candidatus Omnitrophota bacterium]